MAEAYSHLYNAVILPVTPLNTVSGVCYQISANRNDRGTARYLSPIWSEAKLRLVFLAAGTSEAEFQDLLRGNRRASGGRDARRLLYNEAQLQKMGLKLDLHQSEQVVEAAPSKSALAVFHAITTA